MCFGLFDAPKTPDLPTPPPLPEANPAAFNTAANRNQFGLEALRRRAAGAGSKQNIKTSPLGIVDNSAKKILGA